jgi:hypothetical protein
LVDFGGKTKAEARGIVDLIAIRKDHRQDRAGLKRGDLLENGSNSDQRRGCTVPFC